MSRKAHARPKVKELRKLYKGLNATSVAVRVNTLKTALQWYDQALEYLKEKTRAGKYDVPNIEVVRSEERMLKARRLGISSDKQPEKETAFRTAIQIAEGICKRLHTYSVEKAFAESDAHRTKVEARRARLMQKYLGVVIAIDVALKPLSPAGEKLQIIVDDVSKAREYGGGDEYIYNRATMKACQQVLRRSGLLILALQELKFLSRATATEVDEKGHFKVNPEKQVEAVFTMLDNMAKHFQSADAPRRLVKQVGARVEMPKAAKRTVTKGHFGSREKIDGLFAAGSKIAALYTLLLDGNWHPQKEAQSVFPGNMKAALKTIGERGPAVGRQLESVQSDAGVVSIRLVKEVA